MAVSGGNSTPSEAFSFVAGGSHQITAFLQAAAHATDKESVVEQSEELMDLPADQRFIEARDIFPPAFGLGDEISEIDEDDLPPWLREFFNRENPKQLFVQLLKLMRSEIRSVRKQLYVEVLNKPQGGEDYVVLSVLLSDYEDLLRLMIERQSEEVENSEALLSLYSLLVSHLILIDSGERKNVYPELIEDLSRTPTYFNRVHNGDSELDSTDLTHEEMKMGILIEGIAELYQEEDITVAKGAELAGIPRDTFEEQLMQRGIRPDYGPETVDELYDDVNL